MSEVSIGRKKEKCENCTKQCNKKQSDEGINSLQEKGVATGEVKESTSVHQVLLSACLACDGCVSENEGQRISQQNLDEINHVLALNKKCDTSKHKILVVSVCPQSLPFFAIKFQLDVPAAAKKLCGFLKSVGMSGHHICLENMLTCFNVQKTHYFSNTVHYCRSSMPRWIRYAERVLGSLVTPHICTARSPQQIMGSLVKDFFARQQKLTPDQIFHVVVAPCFDKKLEAVREEFYNSILETRAVDCVLTSGEILHLMEQSKVTVEEVDSAPLDHVFGETSDPGMTRHEGRGSEGFLEHIFKHAAKELFGIDVQEIVYKTLRNRDFQEVALERDGETLLQFAAVYGFRNIQTLVHRMRKGKVPYQLVEVLSCPGGCLSGRGQAEGEGGRPDRTLVQQMEDHYSSLPVRLPESNPEVQRLYQDWLDCHDSPHAQQCLHTQYKNHTQPPSHMLNSDMQW
uniref:Nuclear prelamin A recognition factor-like n=1 Tax=Sinocyclocheilus grahami TaxID=75366 RepID=A0A672LVL6_SINGR